MVRADIFPVPWRFAPRKTRRRFQVFLCLPAVALRPEVLGSKTLCEGWGGKFFYDFLNLTV